MAANGDLNASPPPAVRLQGVTKRFGDAIAVEAVSLEITGGQLLAVLGENGAGKSTLLKMAAGLLVPDDGMVEVGGRPLLPFTPGEAQRRGVAMVTQHFSLVEGLTAMENVALGQEPVGPLGQLRTGELRDRLLRALEELGATVPLHTAVADLGLGDRQRLALARALVRDARIVILDEPTAVLTPPEAQALYGVLRRLVATGHAVVVVTHKLDEVLAYADDVVVLRRGRLVTRRALGASPPSASQLADLVMGEGTGSAAPPPPSRKVEDHEGTPLRGHPLVVEDLRVGRGLAGATFRVEPGEIVGIAGVEGNGQGELVEVLAGLRRPDGGAVTGHDGAAVVHGDRQREGLVLDASVADNLILGELREFLTKGVGAAVGLIDEGAARREAGARLRRARVVPDDLGATTRGLSGGNQQKIVVARALAKVRQGARLLVLAHPTRGVDLRAAAAIHDEARAAAALGAAVLVVSSDLHELRSLCSRLLVLSRGRIAGTFAPDAPDDVLGGAMLGMAS